MNRTFLLAAAFLLTGQAALALTAEQVVNDLRSQGYTQIEVRNGLTQTRVEAIRGTEKLEVVYDRATGAVLKSETEAVGRTDNTAPGVTIRDRNRDFLRVSTGGDDRSEADSRRGSDDDADDDARGHDANDDDRKGDRGDNRHGGDDADDDNGSDRGDDRGSADD